MRVLALLFVQRPASVVRDACDCSGCDLNAVDNYGDSALKKAAFSGNVDVLKTLLGASCDPNVCDGFMKSPLCVPPCLHMPSSSDKM